MVEVIFLTLVLLGFTVATLLSCKHYQVQLVRLREAPHRGLARYCRD
jgi:hypothetical protein